MSDRPYTRVYHELADEYPEMYDSADLAAFVRLLIAADQAWPQSARWPGYATKQEVSRLADTGLVICDGHRYRIKGMDKERTTRSNAASNAARIRWGNADGNAETMPSRAEPSKAEPSRADAGASFYDLNGGQASRKALDWVDEMAKEYGDDAVIRAMSQHTEGGRVDLKATQSALALKSHQKRKAAEQRAKVRAFKDAEEARKRAENATPEERAKAEENRRRIAEMMAGIGRAV